MKTQILQENLIKALNIASRSVSGKAQLPILANILLATEENKLKVAATNLETGVVIWTGAKVEKEGSITLPAKIFLEYISSLPPEKIEIEVKENVAAIICGAFSASFNGIAASEFPQIPVKEGGVFSFPSDLMTQVVSQVAYASATDESRPILTGVYTFKEDNSFSFVATDGFRLSVKKIKTPDLNKEEKKKGESKKLIIPAKTLLEVSRIISDQLKVEKGIVELGLTKDGNQAIFSFPEVELSTRLLEGDFPDYQKIIPEGFTTRAFLDREEFLRAVRMAAIFARDSANIVKFKFADGRLIISANSPQVGENSSDIEAKIEGENSEIAFNYRFLLDFLNSVSSSEITFEMTGSLNPGVFRIKDDPDLIHIIMPVRLQT